MAFHDLYNDIKHETENSRLDNKTKTDSLSAHYRSEKIRESNLIINFSDEVKRLLNQVPIDMIVSVDHESNNQLLHFRYPRESELKENIKKQTLRQNQNDLSQIEREILGIYNLSEFKVEKPKITGYDVYEISVDYKKMLFRQLFFIQLFKILLIDNEFPIGVFSKFIYDNEINLEDQSLTDKIKFLEKSLDELIKLAVWELEIQKVDNTEYLDFNERDIEIHSLFSYMKLSLDTSEKRQLLNKIIETTNEITNHRLNFHYEFQHNMSSGQQNMINFFSRLQWAKQNIDIREARAESTKSERIILFIDEGEITFHPEWQRRYFKEALDFVKKLFTNSEVQLLITTHSPFVLSDLPKQNVIFLEKDENGNALKSTLDKENTFGANIHDLFSNSFFMESTIGEFATNKIKEIVDFYYKVAENKIEDSVKILNEEYSSKRNRFHFIVESVGDDVIKGILENHIEYIENNLLGESYRKSRIAKLEKELITLRRNNDQDSIS